MSFDSVQVGPDPMFGVITLGLLWGLVAVLVVVRRSVKSFIGKRRLTLTIWPLSVGASFYTLSSFGVLPRLADFLELGLAWLAVAGLFAVLVVFGIRALRRSKLEAR